jgi:hypothetical protein
MRRAVKGEKKEEETCLYFFCFELGRENTRQTHKE